MTPEPDATRPQHQGTGKLAGKVALVTGGDSGIGRAVAVLFAREGADVAIGHLAEEDADATQTAKLVEAEGRRCLPLPGDVGDEAFCRDAVARTVRELGRLDVLVNNAAEQHTAESITDITEEQLERTFRTNIFGMFFMTKAALPHLGEGSAIVNTTSVTAYQGNPIPGLRRLLLPGRAGAAPQRRQRGQRLRSSQAQLGVRPDQGASLRDGLIRALTSNLAGARCRVETRAARPPNCWSPGSIPPNSRRERLLCRSDRRWAAVARPSLDAPDRDRGAMHGWVLDQGISRWPTCVCGR